MKQTILIIGICILLIGCTNIKQECYDESIRLWNSVNNNSFPNKLNNQMAYDKSIRESCANQYYISCIHGNKIKCTKLHQELW